MNFSELKQSPELRILCLGVQEYEKIWFFQREVQKALIQNTGLNTLIVCEHPPVITLGRQARHDSILRPLDELRSAGISIFDVERGGEVTVHEPGQLVCYPIIDLSEKRRDVAWYMRSLEEVILRVLTQFEVSGERIEGKTGVWVPYEASMRKIASIGVRISRWKTLHGIALNVTNRLESFRYIDPCGMKDVEMISLEQASPKEVTALDTSDNDHPVVNSFVEHFLTVFSYPKEGVVYGSTEYLKNLS